MIFITIFTKCFLFLGAASYAVLLTSIIQDDTRDLVTEETSLSVTDLAPGTPYLVTILSTGQERQQSDLTDTVQETTSK